jgi:nitrite reductase/ring-hydroxylating ferredoxin subunit
MIEFAVGSQSVLLTRQEGQLFAFSNVCPHAASPLQEGRRRGYTVKCPNHGYTFDIRTGRAVWPPGEGCRLTRFKITTKDNEILLQLTSPD